MKALRKQKIQEARSLESLKSEFDAVYDALLKEWIDQDLIETCFDENELEEFSHHLSLGEKEFLKSYDIGEILEYIKTMKKAIMEHLEALESDNEDVDENPTNYPYNQL